MLTPKLQSLTHYKKLVQDSLGLKQSIINLVGSVIASGLSAVSLILLSRFLGPDHFGQFSTAFALLLILVRLNDLGLSVATSKLVPTANTPEERDSLLGQIFRLRIAYAGIIIVVGVIVTQFLPKYLLASNPSLILLAFILSGATALFEHAQFSLQALHNFKLSALINGAQGFLKLVFILPFVLIIAQNNVSLEAMVVVIFIVYTLAPALPVILAKTIKPKLLPVHLKLDESVNLSQLRLNIWKIAKHASLGIVCAGIIENIDILFVQASLNDYEAGLLGGVSRIALLLYVLAYALGNVLNPRVAHYRDWLNMDKFWRKAWLIVGASVIGFVFSMFLAQPLILYTIGREYLPAVGVLRIMFGAGFLTIAVIPFIAMFYAFDLPWYFSVTGVLQLLIVLLGNGLLVPRYGIEASAWTRVASRAVLLVFTICLARREFQKLVNNTEKPAQKAEIESQHTQERTKQ